MKAFSLIELMIVIAIIGVLSAIGIPAYTDYITRSKIAASLPLINQVQTEIAEFFATNGRLPNSFNETSYAANNPSADVTAIYYYGCTNDTEERFYVRYHPNIAGVSDGGIVFRASIVNGVLIWRCRNAGSTPMPTKYLPSMCDLDTSAGAVALLPVVCALLNLNIFIEIFD